jgi:hypothetical protein
MIESSSRAIYRMGRMGGMSRMRAKTKPTDHHRGFIL